MIIYYWLESKYIEQEMNGEIFCLFCVRDSNTLIGCILTNIKLICWKQGGSYKEERERRKWCWKYQSSMFGTLSKIFTIIYNKFTISF